MKVLITAFDPFGGEKVNPALEAVTRMKDEIEGVEIIKLVVPTVFRKSIEKLEEALEEYRPDIAICAGQAGGRCGLSVERVAINKDDARIKDNEGNQPIDEKIFEDGENAYFSSLPIKVMVEEIKRAGLPASVSNTAGTFVCNHIMYGLLYNIEKNYPETRGGFIHVPFIPEQVVDKSNMPSMSLENIVKGLEVGVKAVIQNEKDKKIVGGTIH